MLWHDVGTSLEQGSVVQTPGEEFISFVDLILAES